MKRQIFVGILFLSLVLFSCGSSKLADRDSPKYKKMLEKVQDLEFTIENEWADPLRYSRVNLIGNPNFIKFEGDSVEVFLPYYGQRQSGGEYGLAGAIEYSGPLQELRIEEIADKNRILLSFEAEDQTENYNFRVIIYSNGKARTSVTSSQRDQIDYDGEIVESE